MGLADAAENEICQDAALGADHSSLSRMTMGTTLAASPWSSRIPSVIPEDARET
jgi:hypothetical protein